MKNPIRSLYNWVLKWAEHPAGTWALFALAVAESSVFPIPPDVLLGALAYSRPPRSFWYATVSTVGSVIGGIIGYGIGWLLWQEMEGVRHFFFTYVFSESAFNRVMDLYRQYDFWVVFVAAFTPIPYKVITITAGVAPLNFPIFIVASAIGRAARFYLVGLAFWKFGPKVKPFIDKHLNWLTVVFTLLLIGGFVVVRFLV